MADAVRTQKKASRASVSGIRFILLKKSIAIAIDQTPYIACDTL